MPAPPVGHMNAVFRFLRLGAPRVSTWTMGLEDTSTPTPEPDFVAQQLYETFSVAGRPYAASAMVGNWQFIGVTVTLQQETGPLVGEYNLVTTGAAAGAGLTPNVALLIKKVTGVGGRRNRGRFYVPPVWPPETKVDYNGLIDSGEVATLQSQYDAALADMDTAGLEPEIFHTEAPFTPTQVTGFSVQSLVATQRRRLRK